MLFLDFDGVLHPLGKECFTHNPVFEALLREYPFVKVVFSTSWRHGHDNDIGRLAEYFSEDVRDRFIGCTPYLQEKWPPYIKHERYKEIIAYMEGISYNGPWVALDDANDLFPEDLENYIQCLSWVGIDDSIVAKLRNVFNKYKTN